VLAAHSTWNRCSGNQNNRIAQTIVSTTPHPISAFGHKPKILINLSDMFLSKLMRWRSMGLRRQAIGAHQPDARVSERGADAVEIGPRLLGAGLQCGLRRLCERASIDPAARGR
jgi:hypothetical protein